MKLTLKEMNGLLNGKCLPSDLIVGETLAEYLVRKFTELEHKLVESQREFRAADATIENLQMQVEKLAAENAWLKSKGRELLGEACAVYEKLNKLIDPAIGDFIDGQTLHEFQFVIDCETPATDAFLAEVRAQGVEMFSEKFGGGTLLSDMVKETAKEFAFLLRKGVQS